MKIARDDFGHFDAAFFPRFLLRAGTQVRGQNQIRDACDTGDRLAKRFHGKNIQRRPRHFVGIQRRDQVRLGNNFRPGRN